MWRVLIIYYMLTLRRMPSGLSLAEAEEVTRQRYQRVIRNGGGVAGWLFVFFTSESL